MIDTSTKPKGNNSNEPQCQYFVIRKKRLCRMTVRPGRQYCGEHDPHPKTEDGKTDERIPCPNDPKHTCYISKLEKHLAICNARQGELPPYMELHINAPSAVEACERRPLAQIPRDALMLVIDKVNALYDKHIKDSISTVPERPIHSAVVEEFTEVDRSESSLRHLRQASRLLWLAEDEGLVEDGTCYVELGAGKGHLSYYMGRAWCGADGAGASSRVLAVDRASLRHKRDNRLCERTVRVRLRADLAHLALHRVPVVQETRALVGLAKHLCGVATDYALRCVTGAGVAARCGGIVLATCCHHRCEVAGYIANKQLQELGVSSDELNTMLGIVSWATCGDGRSRTHRTRTKQHETNSTQNHHLSKLTEDEKTDENFEMSSSNDHDSGSVDHDTKDHSTILTDHYTGPNAHDTVFNENDKGSKDHATVINDKELGRKEPQPVLTQELRERVGRRAKALLDWGRVLYLREKGFDARLCYFVPSSVSLENVCIVAKRVQ